ncbi:MAG: PAS domain S-box protein [Actinobacteria bacterium]|nr:MAG: PAS domain S-box protein [Actinomycetota bacterium]
MSSEQLFRAALEGAAIGTALVAPDGRFTEVNPALCSLLGYSARTLESMTWQDVSHPDDLSGGVEHLAQMLQGSRDTFRARRRLLRSDGAVVQADIWVGCVRDADGSVQRLVANIADVSAQVRVEEALAQSEARYRLFAENAADAVFSAQADATYTWFSPSITDLLGWQPEDLYGIRPTQLCHPDDLDVVKAGVTGVADGTAINLRARLRTADGDYRWINVRAQPVLDESGALVGRVGAYRDAEADVAADAALSAERQALRATLDALADPHVLLASVRDGSGAVVDFKYEEANPAACHFMRVPREDLLGARMLKLFPSQRANGMFEHYVACVQSGEPLVLHDVRVSGELAGRDGWFDFSGARTGDGLSLTWRDVSNRVLDREALADERRKLQAVLDSALEPHVYLRAERDPDGAITDFTYEQANPAACAYVGIPREDFEGARVRDLFPGRVGTGLLELFVQAIGVGEPLVLDDYPYPQEGGAGSRRFDVRAVRVGDGLSLGWRDVTDRFDAARLLAASEERFRTAMTSAPMGMALTHLDRSFQEVNPSLCRILQRPEMWLLEHAVPDVLDTEADQIDRELRERVLTGPVEHATAEHQMLLPHGERIWVDHSVAVLRDDHGEPTGFVSQFVDITEARHARERMRFMASHDPLTNLMNRRTFLEGVQELLSHKPRTGEPIAVLFMDLDNLKPINDEYGHAAGDAVLAAVARRLREAVSADDLVARIGGDEFVVALTTIRTPDDAADVAADVAAKIHDHAAVPLLIDDGMIPVSISIGISLAHAGDDPESALQRADNALYQAKQQGRGRTAIHTD